MANSGANIYIEWEIAAVWGEKRGLTLPTWSGFLTLAAGRREINKQKKIIKINGICKTRLHANQTSGLLPARADWEMPAGGLGRVEQELSQYPCPILKNFQVPIAIAIVGAHKAKVCTCTAHTAPRGRRTILRPTLRSPPPVWPA